MPVGQQVNIPIHHIIAHKQEHLSVHNLWLVRNKVKVSEAPNWDSELTTPTLVSPQKSIDGKPSMVLKASMVTPMASDQSEDLDTPRDLGSRVTLTMP